jgi:predicted transcriptional regulator
MYNPMVEEIKKLSEKVKELTKKVELLTRENQMCEKEITYLQDKLKEKKNDGDNKTNS